MSTAAYIRVSTEKQLDGAGPAQQRANITAYAMQHGLSVTYWCTDDETGTTEDREQIQLLLTKARAGELKTLLVDRIDRLGRRVSVCTALHDAFKQAGCKVLFVAQEFAETPAGVAMMQMMMVFSQYAKDEWLQRMKQCLRVKALRTGTSGNCRAPFGYRKNGAGMLEPVKDEANAVSRIFALRDRGMSINRIEEELRVDGYRCRKGTFLHRMHIARVLKNRGAYAGKHSFVDPTSPAVQPPLI